MCSFRNNNSRETTTLPPRILHALPFTNMLIMPAGIVYSDNQLDKRSHRVF